MKKIFSATKCLSRADIDQYLTEKLSDDRRFDVENHLLDCPLCSAAVEGATNTETEEAPALDELYLQIDRRVASKADRSLRTIPWNRLAAAAVIVLTISAALIYYQRQDATNYLAFYEDLASDMATTRGTNENLLTEDLIAGVRLYEQKNYQGSLSFFEDFLEEQQSGIASYYAGLSALKTGDLGLAEEYLKIARLNESAFYEPATWHLSRVYFEVGKPAAAKFLLEDLSRLEGGFYAGRAAEILRELE